MTEKLITALRLHIIDKTSLTSVFSPALPQTGDNIACITLLGGSTTNNLCKEIEYSDLQLRVLIRAKENDTEARKIADEVFSALHLLQDLSFNGYKIINTVANHPIFVGKDENQKILYNITFNTKVK